MILTIGFMILGGYLAGSIPFGLILTRLAGYGDIRKIGSGNIGATNVLRTGNKKLALLTLLLDGGKGAAAVLLFRFIAHPDLSTAAFAVPGMFVGLGAVLGHMFPVWLKFKGGKGVATTLGTLLAAAPLAGVAGCGAWLATAFAMRYSSLSALVAMVVAPMAALFIYSPTVGVLSALISVLVFIRHKDNIRRLLKGEEPKIGKKKTA